MPGAFDLNDLTTFVRVVDGGGFAAAARTFGVPKSTLSRRVAGLEARLGAKLLRRSTRAVGLTDVGRAYYERCVRILGEVEDANAAVGRARAAPRGRVRVTAAAAVSGALLGPVLAEFLERHREVSVEVVARDRLVDLAKEGFDLALRLGPPQGEAALSSRTIVRLRTLLCASPAYLEAHGAPASPADLRAHRCIAFGTPPRALTWALTRGDEQAAVKVSARLATNDASVAHQAALRGLGVAALPSFLYAEGVGRGALRPVLEGWQMQGAVLRAVYPGGTRAPAAVRALVAALVARVPAYVTPA
ncbi:MAG TPA: LysR family transcriptional regulator [Polyangiaceae bacterium]|nr:LysR family transcriptional regulator [Polyangiaceae bacterium]